jgi:phosphonate transport system permease protein
MAAPEAKAVPFPAANASRPWRRPPRIADPRVRAALWIGAAVWLVLALSTLDVDWSRMREGLSRGTAFAAAFLRPDFLTRWGDIREGLLESIAMTVAATAIGIPLSIPFGLGAARNLAPLPVYLFCRSVIALSRAFHEVVVAILFVVMLGFGPLAGVATLAFATLGFLAKLLAEEIEGVDGRQVEAIRSTGASFPHILEYAIRPQVIPRFIGLSVYRLDINFRESAVIGVVGAGGIGATLNTAFDRYEYGSAAAILLVIIAIVLVVEITAGRIRKAVA